MSDKHLFFFDVETTGLPKGRSSSYWDVSNWPRIVSICWLITDHAGNILENYYKLIKPEGFIIPQKVIEIHNISNERAKRDGVRMSSVLTKLSSSLTRYNISHLVAHNIDFDRNILFSELVRYDHPTLSKMKGLPYECTMKSSTSYCKIPHLKGSRRRGYKWPKLQELHRHLFGFAPIIQHDAKEDIEATKECFFELHKRGIIGTQLAKIVRQAENTEQLNPKSKNEISWDAYKKKSKSSANKKSKSSVVSELNAIAKNKRQIPAKKVDPKVVKELNEIGRKLKKDNSQKSTKTVPLSKNQVSWDYYKAKSTQENSKTVKKTNAEKSTESVKQDEEVSSAASDKVIKELNAIGRRKKMEFRKPSPKPKLQPLGKKKKTMKKLFLFSSALTVMGLMTETISLMYVAVIGMLVCGFFAMFENE